MCWLVSHGCWILKNKKHYQCYSQTRLFIKSKLHANGVLNLEKSPGLVWQQSVNTFPNSQFQHCWERWWRITAQYLYLKQYRLCSIFTLTTYLFVVLSLVLPSKKLVCVCVYKNVLVLRLKLILLRSLVLIAFWGPFLKMQNY